MARSAPRIALIYDARSKYDLKVMEGVAAYLQEGHHYSVFIEENALKDQRLPDLRSWEGDGIIGNFDDPGIARRVTQARLPVVGFGGGYGGYVAGSAIPYFYTNNKSIATLAADHLLDRGFKHFAYCGYAKSPINGWSQERQDAFENYLRKRAASCATFDRFPRSNHDWATLQRYLGEWLKKLPKPLGVMAANDNRGRQVLEACRAYNIAVPDEIAVVGVDNDELLCRLSSPPLSSVEQGAKGLGYAAAALLEQMIQGHNSRKRHHVFDPTTVVTRQSTDVLAIDDPKVAQAMAFIRGHSSEGIKVPHVVSAVAISRSGLETRFTSALGYSIHTAIGHTKLERVRQLVTETDMPLKQIASESGFKSVQHMTTVFVKSFGQTPGRYRQTSTVLESLPKQSMS
jgi:LacI family transcriptional regulator